MLGKLLRGVGLSISVALMLFGSLLTIMGIFHEWVRMWGVFRWVTSTGWEMLTTTITGNLCVFLVLVGGIVEFFGVLALISAFIGNWSLAVKKRISYFPLLGAFIVSVGYIWYNEKYGYPPLLYGTFMSMFGYLLVVIGLGIFRFIYYIEAVRERKRKMGEEPKK